MIAEGQQLGQVDLFNIMNHIGSIITWNGRYTEDMRSRIAFGETACSGVRYLWVTRGMTWKL